MCGKICDTASKRLYHEKSHLKLRKILDRIRKNKKDNKGKKGKKDKKSI